MAIALLTFVIVLIGATLQRISGMGVGLIASPILALAIGPVEGVLVVNVLVCMNAALTTVSVRKNVDWRKCDLIGSVMVFGVLAAVWLIGVLPNGILQATVGIVLLLALAITTFGKSWIPTVSGKTAALCAGIAAGFTNALAGVAGPTLSVYAQASRWETRTFAATMQPLFMIAGALSAIMKLGFGSASIGDESLGVWIAGLAAMVLGISAGARIAPKVSQNKARVLAISLATAGALIALIRGVLS